MRGDWMFSALFCLFLGGCASTGGFPPSTPEDAGRVPTGMQVKVVLTPEDLAVEEVEFQVNADAVPPTVIKQALELFPEGAKVEKYEVEYRNGAKYYEIAAEAAGREQEVLLTPAGEAVRWKLEVDAEGVPGSVMSRVGVALKGAVMRGVEHVLDGKQKILAYRFKMEKAGHKYKVVVPLEPGKSVVVYRKTPAVIEIPQR